MTTENREMTYTQASAVNSVNADKAKSEFKDGVLKLVLPKTENAKRRTIKVD